MGEKAFWRGFFWRMGRSGFLAGLIVSLACAEGPRPAQDLSPQETAALAGVQRARVTGKNSIMRAEVQRRLNRDGQVAVADPSEAEAPELRIQASCGSDYDLFREPPAINAPSSGEGIYADHGRYDRKPVSEPACEGGLTLYVDGKAIWHGSAKAAFMSKGDVLSLADLLTDRFLKARTAARREGAPPSRRRAPQTPKD